MNVGRGHSVGTLAVWAKRRGARSPEPVRQPLDLRSLRYPVRRALGTRRREDTLEVSLEVSTGRREVGAATDRVGSVHKWLEKLYCLCQTEKIDPAIDLVIDAVDELLAARDLARCDEILARADVERLSTEASVALLMETLRAKKWLSARRGFYHRVEDKLKRERASEADALLAGLG